MLGHASPWHAPCISTRALPAFATSLIQNETLGQYSKEFGSPASRPVTVRSMHGPLLLHTADAALHMVG